MAKKAAKKAAKTSVKKAATAGAKGGTGASKKPAKASGAARSKAVAGRGTKKAGTSGGTPASGPATVTTGKGLSPLEIGRDLVAKVNAGKVSLDAVGHFSDELVSCEGLGVSMEWRGRKAVDAKNEWWGQDHVIHGVSAEGPFVGATGFSVRFAMDVETKSNGRREMMNEVGVYTVRDGKIVREEFMYLAGGD